jgi:hypothetical protein
MLGVKAEAGLSTPKRTAICEGELLNHRPPTTLSASDNKDYV